MKMIGLILGVWVVSGFLTGLISVVAALYFGISISSDGMTILTLVWMAMFFTVLTIHGKKKKQ